MAKRAVKKSKQKSNKLQQEYLRFFPVNAPKVPVIVRPAPQYQRTFTTYGAYETPIKVD